MQNNNLLTCSVLIMWRLPAKDLLNAQQLEVDTTYEFVTVGNAALPLDIPIDLIDADGAVVGQGRVLNYETSLEETRGTFALVSLTK